MDNLKLKFFRPERKKINKYNLQREMLNEAIALLVLNTDYNSEQYLRTKLREIAKERLLKKKK